MTERMTDEELRRLLTTYGFASDSSAVLAILDEKDALRARVAELEAALEAQRDHWRWIVKAYPNSGASATAGYALAAIDDAGG